MPELELPPRMAALRPEIGDIVENLERELPYGAVLLSSQEGLWIQIDSEDQSVTEEPPMAGAVVTVNDGKTLHERAVGGLDPRSASEAAEKLASSLTASPGLDIDPGPKRQGDFETPMKVSPNSLSVKEKLDWGRELQRKARGLDERVVNVRVTLRERSYFSVFRNRHADLAQHVQRLYLLLLVFVADSEGRREYDVGIRAATGGWETLEFSDEELQELVENAVSLLSAERIEPGEYTVVASPRVAGLICHESFGHGVETDMFLKERARAAHYVDQKVGSPLVNIYDDPSVPGALGSYFFDDEGWPAGPTQIVEDGVFRRGITDLYSASALGIPRSPNGRRQDFTRKAYARMSNTFFGRGETPVEDLFAQVDDGIYLDRGTSGVEDPQGWGIQVICSLAREIKNGQVTDRVFSPVGVTGYVPHVLQSIEAASDEWGLDAGQCGKGHKEYVFVTSGGPHLLMKASLG
ncbi:MAG: TldD/PmbA family protein [Anaerolineae bacterium]